MYGIFIYPSYHQNQPFMSVRIPSSYGNPSWVWWTWSPWELDQEELVNLGVWKSWKHSNMPTWMEGFINDLDFSWNLSTCPTWSCNTLRPWKVIYLPPKKSRILFLPSIMFGGGNNCWTSGGCKKCKIQDANGVDQPYPWCMVFFVFSVRIAW